MQAEIARMLLEVWPRAVSHIHEFLRHKFGQVPAYRTVDRFVRRYEAEHREELLFKFKPSQWRHEYMPSLGDAAACAQHPNAVWEGDTTPADVICKDGKRRKVIAFLDVYPRRAVCRLVEKEDAAAVAGTLRAALLDWGLPEVLKMDNGMVYHKSKHVQRICAELGIETPRLPVRAPETKPHIERFFRTLSEGLFAELAGYTGNCLAARPEVMVPNLTAEELQGLIDEWLAAYHETVHSTTGQRPRERAQVLGHVVRRVDVRQLDLLLLRQEERCVRQAVISFEDRKYYHPALPNGRRVQVRPIPEDAGRLLVFQDGKLLCEAKDQASAGLSVEEINRAKRRYLKALKQKLAAQEELLKPLPQDARVREMLKAKTEARPLSLPAKSLPAELSGYKEAIEALAAQAKPVERPADPDPEAEERPWFTSDMQRYEWCLRRRCLGLPQDEEYGDAQFMAAFEDAPLYEKLRGYFAGVEQQWSRRRANAS
jgi:transposase InsO family protein